MADSKSLKGYWEEFFAASAKASDLNRSLSLGGIAIIWIFNKVSLISAKNFVSILPPQLVLPLLFIVLSLAADLLQYIWRTITIYIFYRANVKKLKDGIITQAQADNLDAARYIRIGGWLFFILKITFTIIAYMLIFSFLVKYL